MMIYISTTRMILPVSTTRRRILLLRIPLRRQFKRQLLLPALPVIPTNSVIVLQHISRFYSTNTTLYNNNNDISYDKSNTFLDSSESIKDLKNLSTTTGTTIESSLPSSSWYENDTNSTSHTNQNYSSNNTNLSHVGLTLGSIIHTNIPFVHTYSVDEIELIIYQIDSILLNHNNTRKTSNSTSSSNSSSPGSSNNIQLPIILTNYHVTNLIEPLATALLQTIIQQKTNELNVPILDYRINSKSKTAVILIEHLLNICLYNIPNTYNTHNTASTTSSSMQPNDNNNYNNDTSSIIDMIYYRMIVPYPTIQLYNTVLYALCNFYGMANTVDEIFNLIYYEYEREYNFLQTITSTTNDFNKQFQERYDNYNTIKPNNTQYKKEELLYCRSSLPNKDTYRYVIRSWSNIKPNPSSTVNNNKYNKNNRSNLTKSNEVVEPRNSHAVPRTARMYLSHLEDICISALDTNTDFNKPFSNSRSSGSNYIQDTMMKRTHSLQSTTTSTPRMIDSIPKQQPINPMWKVLHKHYADTHTSRNQNIIQKQYGGNSASTDNRVKTKTDTTIQQNHEQEQYFLSLLPDRQMYQTLLLRVAYGATTIANRYRDVQSCISESVQIIQSMTKIRQNLLSKSYDTTTTTKQQQTTTTTTSSMSSSTYYRQIANLYKLNNVSYFSILSCYQKYIELFPLIWDNRHYQQNDTNNRQSWNNSTSTYNNTSSYNNNIGSKDSNKGSLDVSILSRMITILEKMLEQQQDYNNNSNSNNNNDYIVHDNYETLFGHTNQVPQVTISSAYGIIVKALLRTESEPNTNNIQSATDILLLLTDKKYSTEYRRTKHTTNNYKTSSDTIIDILLNLTSIEDRQTKKQQQQQLSFQLGWPSSDIILEVLQGWENSSPTYEKKRIDRIKQSTLLHPNAPWFNTSTVRQSENDDYNNSSNAKKQSLLETVLYFWSEQSNLTNNSDVCHSLLQIAIQKQRPVFVRYLQNRPYAIGKQVSTNNIVSLSPLAFEIVLLYWLHTKRDDSPQKIELLVRKLIELHTLEVTAYCTERKYNIRKFAISKQKGKDVFQFTPTEVHIRYLLTSWINFCRTGKKYYTIDNKEFLYPAQHCENIINSIENEYWFKDNYVGNYAFALRAWAEQEMGNNNNNNNSNSNIHENDGIVINPVHHARKLLNQYKAHVQQYYKNVPSFKLPPYASNWVLMVCKRQQLSHDDKLDAYQLAVDTFQETHINARSFVLMVEVIKEQLLISQSLPDHTKNNIGNTDNNNNNTYSLPAPVVHPEILEKNETYLNYIILLFQQACVDGLVSNELIVHVLQIATPDILIDMFRGSTYTDCDLAIFIAKKAIAGTSTAGSTLALSSVQVSNFVAVDTDSLPPSFRLKNLPPKWTCNVVKSRR